MASKEEILEENRKVRRLQIAVDLVLNLVAQSDIPVEEASELVAQTRRFASTFSRTKRRSTTSSTSPSSSAYWLKNTEWSERRNFLDRLRCPHVITVPFSSRNPRPPPAGEGASGAAYRLLLWPIWKRTRPRVWQNATLMHLHRMA